MIIKTREHYERLLAKAKDRDFEEMQEFHETIKALGKVTRAVQTLDLMKAGLEGGRKQSIHKAEMRLADAMVKIPDWLTGANFQ